MSEVQPIDYQTLPLELFTVTDLTDALTVEASAVLLDTSRRAIYTIRNTNALSPARMVRLINEVKTDEATYRQRLVVMRNMQSTRRHKRAEQSTTET